MDYFHLSEDKQDILNMSSLGLAYLGDAVYEVMVRSWLCLRGKLTPGALHRSALDYVAAPRQAALLEKLLPVLRSRGLKVGAAGSPPGGDPGIQAGPQRQSSLPSPGCHPPGVSGCHRTGGPVWLALSPGRDRTAQ